MGITLLNLDLLSRDLGGHDRMGTLDDMDTLLLLRGIIAAGEERRGGMRSPDVRVPLSLLMRAADEIAVARDRREAHGGRLSTDAAAPATTPQASEHETD